MRNVIKLGVLFVVVVTSAMLLRPFVWCRVFGAEFFRDGRRISDARLFKDNKGTILIVLQSASRSYTVRPEYKSVGFPVRGLLFETSVAFFTTESPLPSIGLGSPKTGTADPKSRVVDGEVQFVDKEGLLVNVKW